MATVAYAAPEVLSGMPFDHRADVYSLGCTLFRLLTGKPPFFAAGGVAEVAKAHLEQPPPPVTAHMPGLPPALDPVLARALAKDPSRRFQSAGEFAAAAAAAMRDHTRDSAGTANATPGSGWLKAVQQPLTEAKGPQAQDNWWILFPRRVVEAVVNFVSADKAADFLTNQKGVWAQCANHAINFKSDNPADKPIDLGDFKIMPDGTLTMTVSEEGAMGDTCARALAVRNNVAIDLHACSRDNPMEQALAMVKKIAAKIPQR